MTGMLNNIWNPICRDGIMYIQVLVNPKFCLLASQLEDCGNGDLR